MSAAPTLFLAVRRVIRAKPERVFAAWTTPSALKAWWGPPGVDCEAAVVDARVGGCYRIDNRLVDGRLIVISGQFLAVDSPHRLQFSWNVEPGGGAESLVAVAFETHHEGTLVRIEHSSIADDATRKDHELGWRGCLDGLAEYTAGD